MVRAASCLYSTRAVGGLLPKQSHPAQRARFAVGLAGATGFVAMVPSIAQGSMKSSTIDLGAVVSDARSQAPPQIDLDGSALAGAAARTPGGPAVPNTFPSDSTAAAVPPAQVPESTAGSPTPGAETTPDPLQPSTTSPATTAPPTTAPPTTAPPTTDTTSSAS